MTTTPSAGAPAVKPTRPAGTPATTKFPADPALPVLKGIEWLALNADEPFKAIAAELIPGFRRPLWEDYALAVQDLWDLNTGSDPFPYCPDEVDWQRFSAAEARAFAIDDRTQRRDSALAALLEAIREAS